MSRACAEALHLATVPKGMGLSLIRWLVYDRQLRKLRPKLGGTKLKKIGTNRYEDDRVVTS